MVDKKSKRKIQTLNAISQQGLQRFPERDYEVSDRTPEPDAILVRSHNMHQMDIPGSVIAVGRAGAGINNIPVELLGKRGVVVFNTPGANANAVKELVFAGMFLACRNICRAWEFVKELSEQGRLGEVESGKKKFAGYELAGKTLGVIGLGAIGVQVANTARALGMHVLGFDPKITIQSAWRLSSEIQQAKSLDDILHKSDFVSLHVPLFDSTHHLMNSKNLKNVKQGAVVLNFSRGEIVDAAAMYEAVNSGLIKTYVCDFPDEKLGSHPNIIMLPHLGASTDEAEENCAVMVVDQIIDYLENGNIRNSVNLPDVLLPKLGLQRLSIVNKNCPGMVGEISKVLGEHEANIIHMHNESKQDLAYTLIDLASELDRQVLDKIASIEGVLQARVI